MNVASGVAENGGFDAGEITPVRLRGKLVRFYLPDVLQELREKAKTSKRNVARRV